MKCYYELLGVPKEATDDEIKKAYKKLALKWHPDKNVDNAEVAKETFQLVQQAYEVLSDPHERTWYDNHREAILKGGLGGDYQDDSFDILPYFSASCYKGFGDDPKGFYAVYEEVFKKLAAEDSEYMKEDDPDIPSFGNSSSSYEEVVSPFYSYWMYYSTKKTYYWLDVHDTRQAPNNKIAKLIEKENKKVRDKAKKERNEEVRNLVAFVRKRDKRVQEWNKLLEIKAKENKKKLEENRLQKLQERRNQMENYQESEWLKFSNVENDLKQIEENVAKDFGDCFSNSENDNTSDVNNIDSYFCVACNKVFKTEKSFANHEKSKKHKESVQLLKKSMTLENDVLNLSENHSEIAIEKEENHNSVMDNEDVKDKKKKKKSKQKKFSIELTIADSSDSDNSNNLSDLLNISNKKLRNKNVLSNESLDEDLEKKGKKKNKKQAKPINGDQKQKVENNCKTLEDAVNSLKLSLEESKELTSKKKLSRTNKTIDSSKEKQLDTNLMCAVCKNVFPSKNKLFNHLKSSGHSVYLPNSATAQKEKESTKKKNRQNC